MKNGFFIEAGSYDGEFHSDTLYFESNHNWTGILGNIFIEAGSYDGEFHLNTLYFESNLNWTGILGIIKHL